MTKITEDTIEQTALTWLDNLGYEIARAQIRAVEYSLTEIT